MAAALWLCLVTLAFCSALWKLVVKEFWIKPRRLEAQLVQQGIRGPPRSILSGNVGAVMKMRAEMESRCLPGITHDIVPYSLPHIVHWSEAYGFPFRIWWGTEPSVVIKDLDMIKEVLYNKSGAFWNAAWHRKFQTDMLGRGMAIVMGEEWAFRRRMVSPAFHQEKIKEMGGCMQASILEMLETWSALTEAAVEPVELEVCEELTRLTSDIISRAAFGSSYKKGHRVFELLLRLQGLVCTKFTSPWINSVLPTCKINREIRNIKKQLNQTLERVILARQDQVRSSGEEEYGNDVLGLMLKELDRNNRDEENGGVTFTIEGLIEECKTMYVAGQETSSAWMAWTIMLLAANPHWQDRTREELEKVCGSEVPDVECLSKLKIVTMVVNESLRLYSPALYIVRTCYKDTSVGNLFFPEGSGVFIPVLQILHDKEIWGEDAQDFNPGRFADGVASASKGGQFAFLPFSVGQRVCLGQAFAVNETKLAIAMMLQRFRFKLSPNYRHSPVQRLVLVPQHGVPVLLQRL